MAILLLTFGACIAYFAISTFFWYHPHLIYKKKKNFNHFKAHHISHRGGCADGYENTIKNFAKCVKNGTDMIELDVRLTKDGQVIVFHDQDLKRIAGLSKNISELNYPELPCIKESIPIDNIPGENYSDQTWTENDRSIPLLSEVFLQFPNIPMNIDIKDPSQELVIKVAELVEEFDRSHITVWGSFNANTCKLLYEANPNVGLFFSMKSTLFLIFGCMTGLLPFMKFRETHYEVFLPNALKKRIIAQNGALTFKEKILFLLCQTLLISKSLVDHLHKRGIHVYLWVLNAEDEYYEALKLDVDGIMTDHPILLKNFLAQHTTDSHNKTNMCK